MGYSAARDIIRRDFASSLEYARRTNIRRMLVIGGNYCSDDEVYIIRVADGTGVSLKKELLFASDGRFDFDRL
jgi:ATP phosphoribosyltransferase regulatory subunit